MKLEKRFAKIAAICNEEIDNLMDEEMNWDRYELQEIAFKALERIYDLAERGVRDAKTASGMACTVRGQAGFAMANYPGRDSEEACKRGHTIAKRLEGRI